MRILNRDALLGDALATLGVRRTPTGRRRIITRAQSPFAVVLAVTAIVIASVHPTGPDLPLLVAPCLVVAIVTALSYVVPWESHPEVTGIGLGALDLAATAVVSIALVGPFPQIGALQLIPVLILSFSFGLAGVAVAIVGSTLIAVLPAMVSGTMPETGADWVRLLFVPVLITIVALATQAASRLLRTVQQRATLIARRSENEQAVTMTVLNSMDVGTAYVRSDGTLAFTNEAFREIVERAGIDSDSRAGTLVYETDRETPIPPDQQMMAQAARGEYFDSRLYVIGAPGTAQRSILVTARPVLRADGEHIGSAFVSKDITELADSLRVRDEFLSVVSHELRTPLTSIIGYLELVDDDIDAETLGVRTYLDTISRNAQQLLQRIGDLLHVADRRIDLLEADLDLTDLVAGCVEDVRSRASASSIAIEVLAAGPIVAHADASRMRQVVDNLLTNAIKYSDAGDTVRVRVLEGDDAVCIHVEDDGVGIADVELDHVFERFYRTTSARDAAVQGTGIGLSIVADIVEAHGGEVEVRSTLGVGSVFTVTLPRA